jgi:hypothetical protein
MACAVLVPALVAGCGGGREVGSPGAGELPAGQGRWSEALTAPSSSPSQSALRGVEPGELDTLEIGPADHTITADEPGVQLRLVRRRGGFGGEFGEDLTSRAVWRVDRPELAAIDHGYLSAGGEGEVQAVAEVDGQRVAAKVRILPRGDRSWDFADDVMPVLSRAGCNTGSCHGRAGGQNGFRLSIFGSDPELDYTSITREAGQRRMSRLDPGGSLLLLKATGRVAHGGGRRISEGSLEDRILKSWLMEGAPRALGRPRGAVESLEVEPSAAMLPAPGPVQLRVVARFSDGRRRDVTRLAGYRSTDDTVAEVDAEGRVQLRERGEAAIVVRYRSQVAVVRLGAPLQPQLDFEFAHLPRRNFIDEELYRRLEQLRIPPSPPASDTAFLRRATLDLIGRPPTPEEVRRFLSDADPGKRPALVNRLLAMPDFVLFWRIKLGDLLQISSARQGNGAYRYQEWIDRSLAENTPWDEVVRALLTAVGDPNDREQGGPVNYALDPPDPADQAEATAQRFLGVRIRCARCHDHPFDVWTQDDYFALAAFFARVRRGGPGPMSARQLVTIEPQGRVFHLRTGEPVSPRFLDGGIPEIGERDDPRVALARWITDPANPYFARATANWVWAQLFGRGLVEPADDLSRSNPPVHPDLLDALARHFVARGYDLRDLIRTIATSEAYGLSSAPVPGNERDLRFFSHHLPRPLTAHQMADALAQATGVPNRYPGADPTRRAVRVPDPSTASTILDTFGRCSRTAPCSPVPAAPVSLAQSLLLIGGDVIQGKVESLGGYLAGALELGLDPEDLIESLYYRTLCRPPTAEERSRWGHELKQAPTLREAAEDLFWALLNCREFAFNH